MIYKAVQNNIESFNKRHLGYSLILLFAFSLFDGAFHKQLDDQVVIANASRVQHAKALLGRSYSKSILKRLENPVVLKAFIYDQVERALPEHWRENSHTIARTIIEESGRYHLDPMFLMAMITRESRFQPDMVGSVGELGLMQIKPDTAEWIVEKQNLPEGYVSSLKDPVTNIRVGAAYVSYLKNRYSQHYISAYNMGAANVRRALERNIVPRDYAANIMGHYMSFYRALFSREIAQASAVAQN